MFTFIVVLIIVASVLMSVVVLAQNPKGGGLSSQFGGTGSSQLMGVKRTGDFLEKSTWGLAIALVVLCLSSFVFINNSRSGEQGLTTPGMEKAGDQSIIDMNQNNAEPLGVDTVSGNESSEGDGLNGLLQEEDSAQ